MPKVKTEPSVPKTRQKNYTEVENVWLSRAFATNSANPEDGNEMRSDDFWKKVEADYTILQVKESPEEDLLEMRGFDSLRQRFKKVIQPDVSKFLSVKNGNPIESGESPQSYQARLLEIYSKKHGRPFKFGNCVEYLKVLPKFAPSKEAVEVDGMAEEEDSGVKTVVPNVERPAGYHATQSSKKRQKLLDTMDERKNKALDQVRKEMSEVRDLFQQKVEMDKEKRDMDKYVLELEELKDQRSFLMSVGDKKGAMEVNSKIRELMEARKKAADDAKMATVEAQEDCNVDDADGSESEHDEEEKETDAIRED